MSASILSLYPKYPLVLNPKFPKAVKRIDSLMKPVATIGSCPRNATAHKSRQEVLRQSASIKFSSELPGNVG